MKNKITKKEFSRPKSGESFWTNLPKPFFVLAPMANVTDYAFRQMIAKYGKPDVIWTEFVSADGLCSSGKDKLLIDLKYSRKESPIVAQLFTGHPEAMKEAAKLCADLGFDGLDINMGCPDRAVEKQGGGSAMIKNPKNAVAVIEAAREGVMVEGRKKLIPVSVKTRLGYNKVDMDWIRLLLAQKLPALTIHLRTRKEMSDVPAHWELMGEIVKLRDEIQREMPKQERTLLIGNGDVESVIDGSAKIMKYGCDGVMIGRGIFGTPWLFKDIELTRGEQRVSHVKKSDQNVVTFSATKTPPERLAILVEHAKLYEKTFKGIKNFAVMKKHFKAYVSGWDGAKELRVKLMEAESVGDVTKIVRTYLAT